MGYSSQLKSPTGVPCTRSPPHTPLPSVPSTLAQAPRALPPPGITQAAGMRARRMAAKATTAKSAIQAPRFTSLLQDERGIHQAGRVGSLDGGGFDAGTVLLGEAAEPGDETIERRTLQAHREGPGARRLTREGAGQPRLARRAADDHEQRLARGRGLCRGRGELRRHALHPAEVGALAGEAVVSVRDAAIERNEHAEDEDQRGERESPEDQAPLARRERGQGFERESLARERHERAPGASPARTCMRPS